jgi:hypothetical protein
MVGGRNCQVHLAISESTDQKHKTWRQMANEQVNNPVRTWRRSRLKHFRVHMEFFENSCWLTASRVEATLRCQLKTSQSRVEGGRS